MLWPWRPSAATARQAAVDLDTRDALTSAGTRVRAAVAIQAAALDTKDTVVKANRMDGIYQMRATADLILKIILHVH